jgi:hypothetical protein
MAVIGGPGCQVEHPGVAERASAYGVRPDPLVAVSASFGTTQFRTPFMFDSEPLSLLRERPVHATSSYENVLELKR